MQVEAVLFDLFNTLVLLESDEVFYTPCLRRLHEFLVKNGINVPFNDFKRVYFEVRDRLYAETEKSLEEPHFNVRVSQILQRFSYYFDVSHPVVTGATMAFADELMHYVHLDVDAVDVLSELRGKYKLGIVSNFAIPECAWKLLDKFGLKGFFDVVVVSGAVNQRKPSPKIFEKALNALSLDASRVVFVGDMLDLDVKGAKNVGVKAILIERRPVERIGDVKPDMVVKSLRELPVMLEDC
jgi:HAD superfamily hydrolase (TIGR01509 family)